MSAPTFLESTSLVFAYGFDVYQTLRRPSQAFDVLKEDFNHVALLGTMGGLVGAIYIVQHFSDKKRLNDAWK